MVLFRDDIDGFDYRINTISGTERVHPLEEKRSLDYPVSALCFKSWEKAQELMRSFEGYAD